MSVCTTPMCSNGRAAVKQMWDTFHYLTTTYENFNKAHFEPTVNAIQAELDAIDSWYADLIPFNPVCCTIEEIGNEATALTNEMLTSVNAADIQIPPLPGETDWTTLIIIGGVILLAVVYSPQIKKVLH